MSGAVVLAALGLATMTATSSAPTAPTAPIGVVIIEMQGVTASDRNDFLVELMSVIEKETGQATFLDSFVRSADELRANTDTDIVVSASLVAGARLARLSLECSDGRGTLGNVRLNVGRTAAEWKPRIPSAVRALFPPRPERTEVPRSPVLSVDNSKETPAAWVGWASVGTGAAFGIVGAVLRVTAEGERRRSVEAQDAHNASESLDERATLSALANQRSDRSRQLGLTSNISLIGAGALLAGGIVYLWLAD